MSSHDMPFGAVPLPEGGVLFRLWAPAARTVELCLEHGSSGPAPLSLEKMGQGWFSLHVPHAGAGSLYRYRIDGEMQVPDPASRFQPDDVNGPSQVVDPHAWSWRDTQWRGRPWEEAVIYELHIGAFTEQGGYAGVEERLDHLRELGVTALELMPIAEFPGGRNWGYDGVLSFAPDAAYGRPDDLKRLVDAAHARGLMVLLDVVYNHFGPEGNYLRCYAPQFFNPRHHTPWGEAINFDGEDCGQVREFFIHNALYWIEEYHFDGLRFDAVHAIMDADDSNPDFLTELAARLRDLEASLGRHLHLVLENEHNSAARLTRWNGAPAAFTAQWNDDIHHCLHVLLTGENEGYYADFVERPLELLGRGLAEGFAWQGEQSPYRGDARGEPSSALPPGAFVNFLQNHDQIGNRALGERLSRLASDEALRAATAVLLLAPQPPMLYMGQEWNSEQPFLYFCDFHGDLAKAVRDGRREEFSRFAAFADPALRDRIPDPNDPRTLLDSRLDWERAEGEGRSWLELHRRLLALRHDKVIPRLAGMRSGQGGWNVHAEGVLQVEWRLGDASRLTLLANLSEEPAKCPMKSPAGAVLYSTHGAPEEGGVLPAWSAAWYLDEKKENE